MNGAIIPTVNGSNSYHLGREEGSAQADTVNNSIERRTTDMVLAPQRALGKGFLPGFFKTTATG